jgi:hypothetical protein
MALTRLAGMLSGVSKGPGLVEDRDGIETWAMLYSATTSSTAVDMSCAKATISASPEFERVMAAIETTRIGILDDFYADSDARSGDSQVIALIRELEGHELVRTEICLSQNGNRTERDGSDNRRLGRAEINDSQDNPTQNNSCIPSFPQMLQRGGKTASQRTHTIPDIHRHIVPFPASVNGYPICFAEITGNLSEDVPDLFLDLLLLITLLTIPPTFPSLFRRDVEEQSNIWGREGDIW